jgi:hypothetical protein
MIYVRSSLPPIELLGAELIDKGLPWDEAVLFKEQHNGLVWNQAS